MKIATELVMKIAYRVSSVSQQQDNDIGRQLAKEFMAIFMLRIQMRGVVISDAGCNAIASSLISIEAKQPQYEETTMETLMSRLHSRHNKGTE